jgi:predicted 3-demethylubiquinone-9 3-methyltransferase (glyoxalase superfamily)
MTPNPKIRTCLWFESRGDEAAAFYVSLLPDSAIDGVLRFDPAGPPHVVDFTLAGVPYMALNGGAHYRLSPAASIAVRTADQAETDRLWDALLADGGEASMCGWLTDRFGVSWQIYPEALLRLMSDPDREAAARVDQALHQMQKVDIAVLAAAHRGAPIGQA